MDSRSTTSTRRTQNRSSGASGGCSKQTRSAGGRLLSNRTCTCHQRAAAFISWPSRPVDRQGQTSAASTSRAPRRPPRRRNGAFWARGRPRHLPCGRRPHLLCGCGRLLPLSRVRLLPLSRGLLRRRRPPGVGALVQRRPRRGKTPVLGPHQHGDDPWRRLRTGRKTGRRRGRSRYRTRPRHGGRRRGICSCDSDV